MIYGNPKGVYTRRHTILHLHSTTLPCNISAVHENYIFLSGQTDNT
ncbi:hypothetical protein X793_04810 [Dehalococcoides mccartyi CG4]|nr:hypothetical protein [Dehalococcoides mccartyi]AII60212.1 hypothetical protein X793_04810 [Dehalococcoides mccartyi CG4]MBF4483080.1 hypothetical protein [Dehalococcoides mccartyi]